MTVTMFMALLVIFALIVSLVTEAEKKFMEGFEIKYSANVAVLITSIIVGVGGTALVYLFIGIPFTPTNILCMILMGVAVWVGSMVGYDKVLQMIEQIKAIKM